MHLTATHINYYHICHRKLWLFVNGMNMEHHSETVADGKLLHETSYPQRAEKYSEIEIGGSKVSTPPIPLMKHSKILFRDVAPN